MRRLYYRIKTIRALHSLGYTWHESWLIAGAKFKK
jgi:hypothetical protein